MSFVSGKVVDSDIVGINKIHIRIENIIMIEINLLIKSPPFVKVLFENNKRSLVIITKLLMAGVVGFEPTQAVLETDVLPLTLYP